jgi:hypothetical protein
MRMPGHGGWLRRGRRRLGMLALLGALLTPVGLTLVAQPAAAAGPLVGVLPNANGVCPPGTWDRPFRVYQDNEDSSNKNNRYGWIGGIRSDSNTQTKLCGVDGDRFRSLLGYRVNFAVVALDPACPAGSITFDRYFDDEDSSNNSSSSTGVNSPTTTVNENTNFRFCWFLNQAPAASAPNSAFPDLGGQYGLYGPASESWALDSGWVRTDDEDTHNNNSVSPMDGTLTFYRNQWLTADSNTTLHIVRAK